MHPIPLEKERGWDCFLQELHPWLRALWASGIQHLLSLFQTRSIQKKEEKNAVRHLITLNYSRHHSSSLLPQLIIILSLRPDPFRCLLLAPAGIDVRWQDAGCHPLPAQVLKGKARALKELVGHVWLVERFRAVWLSREASWARPTVCQGKRKRLLSCSPGQRPENCKR